MWRRKIAAGGSVRRGGVLFGSSGKALVSPKWVPADGWFGARWLGGIGAQKGSANAALTPNMAALEDAVAGSAG